MIESFGVADSEPQWILDRATETGPLFWRADGTTGKQTRVKFRCEVEVKEFRPEKHEFDFEEYWSEDQLPESSPLTMGMTGLFCMAITVMLPWYLMGFDI